MRLTASTLLPYLREQRLLGPAEIESGRISVTDACRRNCNFKVRRAEGGYFVKQAFEGPDGDVDSLIREAAFYRFCEERPDAAAVRDILPRPQRWLSDTRLLVLELLEDVQPLYEFAAARSPAGLSREVGALLGSGLAALHRSCPVRALDGDPLLSLLPRLPPWLFSIHQPGPELLATASAAIVQLVRIIQRESGLRCNLERLRAGWRCETLVHGDVKADNLLLSRRSDGGLRLAVIDWELVQLGDPAWDVGSALQELLRLWIDSMPISRDRKPEELVGLARFPLEGLHPASAALWDAYRERAGLDRTDQVPFLLRATRYCAARLLHSAYEQSQETPILPNQAVMMVQVASNIFSDPGRATAPLLGIPLFL